MNEPTQPTCPKCGCQTIIPFGDGKVIHDTEACQGIAQPTTDEVAREMYSDTPSSKKCTFDNLSKSTKQTYFARAKWHISKTEKLRAGLQECRDRIAAHDGCSRYQIGDSCIIERADKLLRSTNPQPKS